MDLVINESNFNQYFFDMRDNGPKKNQIIARYTAIAELRDGSVKRFLVNTLQSADKGADIAQRLMKYQCRAVDPDTINVPLEISKDLDSGMTREQVLEKPYKFQIEFFYWTMREYVPENDPHWEIISISKSEWDYAYEQIDREKNQNSAK